MVWGTARSSARDRFPRKRQRFLTLRCALLRDDPSSIWSAARRRVLRAGRSTIGQRSVTSRMRHLAYRLPFHAIIRASVILDIYLCTSSHVVWFDYSRVGAFLSLVSSEFSRYSDAQIVCSLLKRGLIDYSRGVRFCLSSVVPRAARDSDRVTSSVSRQTIIGCHIICATLASGLPVTRSARRQFAPHQDGCLDHGGRWVTDMLHSFSTICLQVLSLLSTKLTDYQCSPCCPGYNLYA